MECVGLATDAAQACLRDGSRPRHVSRCDVDRLLNRVAIVAVGVCLAALFTTATVLAVTYWRAGAAGSLGAAPSYAAGEKIDVPGMSGRQAEHTLLIFARSTCAACQAAKSTLAEIVAAVGTADSVDVAMVTSSSAPSPEAELQYASEIGIANSQVILMDTALLRLKKVPAVALIDSRGTVLTFKEGALDIAPDDILMSLESESAVLP